MAELISIGLWKKQTGNLMSHGQGLTEAQIAALKELKPGDRLIAWSEVKKSESQPDYTLKVFNKGGI